jgi:hypothetical protein
MRVYTSKQLEGLSKQELQLRMDMVNSSNALTMEEVIANRDMILLYMNNGVRYPLPEVIGDIMAGSADIDDVEI